MPCESGSLGLASAEQMCWFYQGHRYASRLVGSRAVSVLVSAQCGQNVGDSVHLGYDAAFPKPPIQFVAVICGLIIVGTTVTAYSSILLARKHTYLSASDVFREKIATF